LKHRALWRKTLAVHGTIKNPQHGREALIFLKPWQKTFMAMAPIKAPVHGSFISFLKGPFMA